MEGRAAQEHPPGHRRLQELPLHPEGPGGATRRLLVAIPGDTGHSQQRGGLLPGISRLEGTGKGGGTQKSGAQGSR